MLMVKLRWNLRPNKSWKDKLWSQMCHKLCDFVLQPVLKGALTQSLELYNHKLLFSISTHSADFPEDLIDPVCPHLKRDKLESRLEDKSSQTKRLFCIFPACALGDGINLELVLKSWQRLISLVL